MNTRHAPRISRKAAEQLLDGETALGRSHAGGPEQLARVLAAAAAPGREHELAGEQLAVAAFEANHLESAASYRRGQMIKSPLAKLLTTKVLAAALTVFAGGGVALAASTGTFSGPGPAAQTPGPAASSASAPAVGPLVAPSVSVSVSATPIVSGPASSADPLSSAGSQSASSPAADASASSVPQTATALCHALISDANGTSGQQLSQAAQVTALASGAAPKALSGSTEFSPLIGTAQSAAAVPDYCALLLDLPQLPQPGELAQLPATVLSQLLTQLPTATLAQVLTSLPSSTLSAVLTELPSSTVTQLLNELPTSTVSQLLTELPSSVVSGLSGLSGLSNSVASLLPGL
jgi:MgtE intracellular N domain